MTLKNYAAIMTGAFSMVLTVLVLWGGTELTLHDAIAVGGFVYCMATILTFAVIEGIEKRKKKNLAATIITLVREEWEHEERAS